MNEIRMEYFQKEDILHLTVSGEAESGGVEPVHAGKNRLMEFAGLLEEEEADEILDAIQSSRK